jgi:hypothetical protein
MITARLVGDDAVLAWLRAAPDLVASGLARAITTLGIELQRNIQEIELTGQTLGARSGSLESSTSLQIDQSGDRIAATISSGSAYKHAREYSFSGAVAIRANLRRPNRHPRHPPENPRRIDPLRDDPLQLQRAGTIVESLPPGGKRRHRRGDRPGICASSRTRAVSSRTTPRSSRACIRYSSN